MSVRPEFELIPIEKLRIHERIHDDRIAALAEKIRADGAVDVPILVARNGLVILDGHHRFAALQRLGARRIPAWVVDYDAPEIELDRWDGGPAISKAEVLERGRSGQPFPPKTTRHRVTVPIPPHRTPLVELLGPGAENGGA